MALRQHAGSRADQSSSPFFSKLPAEVRTMIYRECFAGSKARVTQEKPLRNNLNRHTYFDKAYLPRNEQLKLLPVCQDFHDEARPIYWNETAVECAYFALQKNLSAIPVHARPHIRVLEGVPPVDGFAHHPIPLAQFMGLFPQLRYCQLRHQSVYIYCLHNKATRENLLGAAGSDAFRSLAHTLNPHNPPVLVQRAYVNSTICSQVSKIKQTSDILSLEPIIAIKPLSTTSFRINADQSWLGTDNIVSRGSIGLTSITPLGGFSPRPEEAYQMRKASTKSPNR